MVVEAFYSYSYHYSFKHKTILLIVVSVPLILPPFKQLQTVVQFVFGTFGIEKIAGSRIIHVNCNLVFIDDNIDFKVYYAMDLCTIYLY